MPQISQSRIDAIVDSGDKTRIKKMISEIIERQDESIPFGIRYERGGDGVDSAYETEEIVDLCSANTPAPYAVDAMSRLGGEGNFILEGDNFAWMKILSATHAGKIDVIYIDPPYNTGNCDFRYNDRFVNKNDMWKSSMWLDFMERRLRLARGLLSDEGMIAVSIDDRMHVEAKMLMDAVFGRENFVANIVVAGNSSKNNARFVGVSHEYVLVYLRNARSPFHEKHPWRVKKNNVDEFRKRASKLVESGLDPKQIHKELCELVKQPRFYDFDHYTYADEKGVYRLSDMTAPGRGEDYDVVHPNGRPCKKGTRGWRYSKEEFDKLGSEGRVKFGDDETTIPQLKNYIDRLQYQTPKSVVFFDSQSTTKWLKSINLDFPFPKPVGLVAHVVSMYPKTDATVLDFFAGSGTTAHAVMQLNAQDGGTRRWILVTSNEDAGKDDGDHETGICSDVTKPRVDAVLDCRSPLGEVDSGYTYMRYGFVPKKATRRQAIRALSSPRTVDAVMRLTRGCSPICEDAELRCVPYSDGSLACFDASTVRAAVERHGSGTVYAADRYVDAPPGVEVLDFGGLFSNFDI